MLRGPLFKGVYNGVLRVLLVAGADLEDLGDGGTLAPMEAVEASSACTVLLLMVEGASTMRGSSYMDGPSSACKLTLNQGDAEVVWALIEDDLDEGGGDKKPAFIWAVKAGCLEVMHLQLCAGADPNQLCGDMYGWTALMYASEAGCHAAGH